MGSNNPWEMLHDASNQPTMEVDPRDTFNFSPRTWDDTEEAVTEEHTGGSSSYYQVEILDPQDDDQEPYVAECIDIVRALGMTADEFNAFKACWRKAAARQGKGKKGNNALYDAEKIEFAGASMVRLEKRQ